MVIFHTNNDGFIEAYFEWDIVDATGRQNFDGEYMYVRDVWVHPSVNGRKAIMRFIGELEVMPKNNSIKYVYWKRHKTGELRISRCFPRDRCVKDFINFIRRQQCSI